MKKLFLIALIGIVMTGCKTTVDNSWSHSEMNERMNEDETKRETSGLTIYKRVF